LPGEKEPHEKPFPFIRMEKTTMKTEPVEFRKEMRATLWSRGRKRGRRISRRRRGRLWREV